MATQSKLPAYYKEYLDERFNHVVERIDGVCSEANGIKKELKRMNGSIRGNKQRSRDNSKNIKLLGGALVAGTFFWVKESRDVLIHIIKTLLVLV